MPSVAKKKVIMKNGKFSSPLILLWNILECFLVDFFGEADWRAW